MVEAEGVASLVLLLSSESVSDIAAQAIGVDGHDECL
jgi:hypothetical protein